MNEQFPGQPHPVSGPAPVPPPADPLAFPAPAGDPFYSAPPQPGYPAAAPQPSYDAAPPVPPQPYGAYPPAAYSGQPPPGQAYPGQPFPGQPYPGQPYPPAGGYPPPGFPPPGFPPAGFPPPGFPMYGQPTKTNKAAVASLICGILGVIPALLIVAVVCGFIALSQIKQTGEKGKGLAVAGLSVAAGWIVLFAVLIAVGVLNDDNPPVDAGPTGLDRPTATAKPTTTEPADVRTDKLRPGDCIATISDDETVYDMPVVACSVPHQGEVYSVTTMAAGAYPGDKKVETEAENRCNDKIDAYAIGKFKDAEFYYIFPSRTSWSADRSITCIAVAPENGTYTGSMVK
ncbi:hypothetical protein GCM10010168_50950 [Actinoplanes ianthinogenes]|uniref:Septum formation-related domain-containing protein n=1 Tax=Actinoplanes ianthinogenes TaxID=122358 RepID=A0ABM7M3G4_9ACTN|nr:DUF4190 domain-containing protein [Actinoplanes ianthinogenes]BCJ46146.1 hypothetical protein Aiant_68030 [Actinoplanes ianthinogenes]GGR26578.1 hypothetical protein GCM10010168_50950 [Actinoplanes ianthinogenes]